MSELERTARVLMAARLALQKAVTSFKPTETRSNLALKLCEKWRRLEASIGRAHKFLGSRAKELDRKEKEVTAAKETLHNQQKEVQLKYETLLSSEMSLSKRIEQVWLRQEEVKKWIEKIDLDKKTISEKEKQLNDRFRALEEREKQVKERLDEIAKEKKENSKNVEKLKKELKQILEKVREEKLESSEKRETDGQVDDDVVSKIDSIVDDEVSDEEGHKKEVTTKLASGHKEKPLCHHYNKVLEEFDKAMGETNKNVKNSKRKLLELEPEKGREEKLESCEKSKKDGQVDNDVVTKTSCRIGNEASENERKRRKTMVRTNSVKEEVSQATKQKPEQYWLNGYQYPCFSKQGIFSF